MKNEGFNYTALKLCGVLGVVYVIQYATGFEPGFNASSSPLWKFFTSILGHSGPEHLFNNLFFIGAFGTVYELVTDSETFLTTFLVAGIFANISAFIFYPSSAIIGASGAAIGVLAALAVYRPNQVGLALGVPAPMWAVLVIYIAINLAGLSASNGVAYEAHLMGMIPGAVIGLYLRDTRDRKDDEDDLEAENWKKKIREWEEKYMLR
ncbi:MAG: rhomboid family intramembrane serine protease [Candidatus Aenigmatarchaeota archaeon]